MRLSRQFFEWEDLSISQSREAVDGWWQTMTGAGYRDDGEPIPLGGGRMLRVVAVKEAAEPDGDPVLVVEAV